jgi:hypothetical protein
VGNIIQAMNYQGAIHLNLQMREAAIPYLVLLPVIDPITTELGDD